MSAPSSSPSQFALFARRRFAPLFVTQFLGAFNDNVFKNALVVLLAFNAAAWTTLSSDVLANLAAGIFILPFFLFSATAGQLADKFDKAHLARYTKLLEILVVLLIGLGFLFSSLWLLLGALFLLGLQSTLFGPVKYAILPQHLAPRELVGGNALVEGGTYVAILGGTLTGALLAGMKDGGAWITGVCLGVALLGYLASRHIPPAPAPVPELEIRANFLRETWRSIGFARENRVVFLSILGVSWFWLYGALFLTQFPGYVRTVLHGDEHLVTLLLVVFSVGVGTGSLFCERLTRRTGKVVEPGLVPLGALGMTLFGLDFSLAGPASGAVLPSVASFLREPWNWRILGDLLLLGMSGGLYSVPLYALIQSRSPDACRARVIAANNILNALFMVAGALAAALLLGQGYGIPVLFCVAAIINGLVTIHVFTVVDFSFWALIRPCPKENCRPQDQDRS
jgi:MFS family permease